MWEDDCFKAQVIYGRMTRRQARRLVNRMCRWYGCKVPVMRWLKTGHRRWRAQQVTGALELNTTKSGWSPLLIAHEVAHWICEQKKLDKQPHDAIWMAVYMNLLDHYRIIPIEATVATAKRYSVEFKAPIKYLPGRV
jgi:hypothetical protein